MVMLSEEVLRGSSWLMIIVGAATYLALQIIAAPYGRHSSSSWGPLIPARLSWMIMESPNLWMPFVIYWISSSQGSIPLTGNHLPNLALLAMFYIHYIHRTLLFPIMMPATRPMPLTVMLCAFSYCLWNSFNQSLSLLLFTNYPSHWLSTPQFLCGALLFFGGLCTNIYADHRLLYLKRQGHQQGKEYIVPKGWLFDFISCPNYCKQPILPLPPT